MNVLFKFCLTVQHKMEQECFADKLIFSDESTLYVCVKVIIHNVLIWGMPNPKEILRRSFSNKMGHQPII